MMDIIKWCENNDKQYVCYKDNTYRVGLNRYTNIEFYLSDEVYIKVFIIKYGRVRNYLYVKNQKELINMIEEIIN